MVAAIEVTEADELATMRAWLRDRGLGGHHARHPRRAVPDHDGGPTPSTTTRRSSGWGRDRATDPELRTMVAAIEVTEADELATMRAWLRDAGPAATAGRHDHTGHLAAPADLARLRSAPAGQVDAVLRELLGSHQQAAADLSRAHLATATSPQVRELATRVEQSRTAEVRLLTAPAAGRR
ncbi:DUF305 domain-containing protein [Micromonospora sp. 4G55]|nr:DUF305 domain-containing protein [Micromonospora sp. 4G55]